MSCPRQFLVARWRYVPHDKPVEFPITEDSYATLDNVAADILDGQIEDVAQVLRIDLDACSAFDVTGDAFQRAADLSFEREAEPYEELRAQFDKLAIRYFGLARQEAAYLRRSAIDAAIKARREDTNVFAPLARIAGTFALFIIAAAIYCIVCPLPAYAGTAADILASPFSLLFAVTFFGAALGLVFAMLFIGGRRKPDHDIFEDPDKQRRRQPDAWRSK